MGHNSRTQDKYDLLDLPAIHAALYLRGLARSTQPSPRRWLTVDSLLRRKLASGLSATTVLRQEGFAEEALTLEECLAEASYLTEEGVVVTGADESYPRRWLKVLGPSAPPALWLEGDRSALGLESVTVVGSRELSRWHQSFAEAAGIAATANGGALISGAAPGADSFAAQAAHHQGLGPTIEILPAGLGSWPSSDADLRLSLWPRDYRFTAAAAMERNVLLYAASNVTVLAHARFKEGGSWNGAVMALRRRLTRLLVPGDDELAHRSLIALGAHGVVGIEGLSSAILTHQPPIQPALE